MKLSGPIGRALVLGVLVGGVIGFTPACGVRPPPVRCSADNCSGCCDENAQCFTGLADTKCGSNGASCSACTAGQTCSAVSSGADAGAGGRCLTGGSVGGGSAGGNAGGAAGGTAGGTAGGSGGGMANCNAQNCPTGCCTPTGICQNPPTTARCGMGGAACMACPGRQSCVSGACQPCNGCVDIATGRCETGMMNDKCGKMGEFCSNCGVSNGVCTNQVCTGSMSGCNPQNCASGCCDQGSGSCIQPASQTPQQCGQGTPAALCTSCMGGTCDTDAGTCLGGGMGGGGAGGGFPFPGLDGGGFGGTPCDANNPCGAGQCCFNLLGMGQCATIGQPPPLLGIGQTCGRSGMACSSLPCGALPFGGQTCNVATGMCQ